MYWYNTDIFIHGYMRHFSKVLLVRRCFFAFLIINYKCNVLSLSALKKSPVDVSLTGFSFICCRFAERLLAKWCTVIQTVHRRNIVIYPNIFDVVISVSILSMEVWGRGCVWAQRVMSLKSHRLHNFGPITSKVILGNVWLVTERLRCVVATL